MSLRKEDEREIDKALRPWRQGDVSLDDGLEFLHFADLSRPHSPASIQVAENDGEDVKPGAMSVVDEVRGVVILSQTCDVVRRCRDRPFVEIAPLIEVCESWVEDIRRLKRPAFAFVWATAGDRLVADLDRTMTVEKAIIAGWTRTCGWTIILLSSKSPELNPVENIWQYLRSNYLSNRVFSDDNAIVDAACDAWNALIDILERNLF